MAVKKLNLCHRQWLKRASIRKPCFQVTNTASPLTRTRSCYESPKVRVGLQATLQHRGVSTQPITESDWIHNTKVAGPGLNSKVSAVKVSLFSETTHVCSRFLTFHRDTSALGLSSLQTNPMLLKQKTTNLPKSLEKNIPVPRPFHTSLLARGSQHFSWPISANFYRCIK